MALNRKTCSENCVYLFHFFVITLCLGFILVIAMVGLVYDLQDETSSTVVRFCFTYLIVILSKDPVYFCPNRMDDMITSNSTLYSLAVRTLIILFCAIGILYYLPCSDFFRRKTKYLDIRPGFYKVRGSEQMYICRFSLFCFYMI